MTTSGRLTFRVVDAFTDRPFSGNPAGVVLPPDVGGEGPGPAALSDANLQAVAAELNLSETAFPYPAESDGTRRLRWFTPTTEVTLCGHATLAAAQALLEAGSTAPLRFTSLSGPLEVRLEQGNRLCLDFPADPPREGAPPPGLLPALGLSAGDRVRYAVGARCALVELPDGQVSRLAALAPDMQALAAVPLPPGVMGVSVTVHPGPGDAEGPDFLSRFFGPWVGVNEDPVTGMAHCLLGPWWAARLDRGALMARQGGGRGGTLEVRVTGDRVHLVGGAVTVAEGSLRLPT
jgi:PhzF family phenazine biosynthesis protein